MTTFYAIASVLEYVTVTGSTGVMAGLRENYTHPSQSSRVGNI